MAYPYATLPTPVDDTTTATPNTHSGHHNSVHGALNDLKTELGSGPKGSATDVTARLTTIETKVLPTGGTTSQVLAKNSSTNYDVGWTTPSGGGSLTGLHSALLAVKVWSSTQYVWSGDGTAPDSNSYTQILFVDPAGTHDPTTSTGGRSNANDLWETGAVYPLADNAVTNTKLADVATATVKGRVAAGTGDPTDLTATQVTTLVNQFTSSLSGAVPSSGGGTTNFLRADGTWAAPTGSPTLTASTQTASYTLVLGDGGTCVEMNVASANTLTVPPNSSVAFPTGTIIEIFQYGAGQTTLTPGSGVTIRSDGAKLKTSAQYASVSLRKRATDEWVAAGDLSA